jgi:hypothetical protein
MVFNEIVLKFHFQDKTIADFVEIKKLVKAAKSWKDNAEFAQADAN